MKLNKDFKRDTYAESFLRETARILGLPETFRYTNSSIGTKINVNPNQLQQLAYLCDWNQKMREQFNHRDIENRISEQLSPEWPFEVVKLYFNIEF